MTTLNATVRNGAAASGISNLAHELRPKRYRSMISLV
jgi:hypothetical protein